MTATVIISKVKFEAKLNATTEYDDHILGLIQEEYQLLHQKHNYQENIVDVVLSATAAVGYIALPSDFLRLKSNARPKFYVNGSEDYRLMVQASEHNTKLHTGAPQYFEIKTGRIYFYPYSETLATHRIALTYYKSPAAVVGATDIPNTLAYAVLNKVIARMLVLKESKAAAFYEKKGEERFLDSV